MDIIMIFSLFAFTIGASFVFHSIYYKKNCYIVGFILISLSSILLFLNDSINQLGKKVAIALSVICFIIAAIISIKQYITNSKEVKKKKI